MIALQAQNTFCSLKVPAEAASHPQISAELSFGECLSENDWLAPLLSGKSVAEFGCNFGLRTAYLAPKTHQIFCTDPDAMCLRLARKTLQLNQRTNVVVMDETVDAPPVDALLFDTRRYSGRALPEFPSQAALLIVTGPLTRSTASRVLDAGYKHLPQYHRAAVFVALRRQHGFQ
ncbi:MAG: hypothetical protein CML60_07975 [Rhodobacteraceae bacterium]|nr:hypothetical protein [Paracoccaceae bacterium]